MAEVSLEIGGRRHIVACAPGGEAQLERLGRLIDERYPAAARATGTMGGERTMLIIALMLADALDEAQRQPAGAQESAALARVAEQLESLAASLENPAPND